MKSSPHSVQVKAYAKEQRPNKAKTRKTFNDMHYMYFLLYFIYYIFNNSDV